ncbi:MAG: hypothetical protein HY898_30495 [Deltaproteobacteria bacterium]|nr:hypothetical protein [Deltaproteobacteria bacterium]
MMQLRFHKGLYSSEAIDAAVTAFEPFASFDRSEESEHRIIGLSCRQSDDDEAVMAGEFSNYVLGATVDRVKPEGQKS